jgi:PhnB protein
MIGFARDTAQEMTMPQPIPYLAFDGNCADAMRFYAKVLEGNGSLYAGDCPPGMPYQGIHGVSITLNYDAVALAERIFNALAADGGKVTMAFGPTFWAKGFGMVTDKFGCPWIINGEMIEMQMNSPGV